jgi:hypothetical protein
MAMKFPERFYCKRTCMLTVYWGGGGVTWAARHLVQPLLETFLELLFWNRSQCHHHMSLCSASWNLRPSKADFIFGNSWKSLSANQEWGGCSISVFAFWARNCLTAPHELELVIMENPIIGPKFRPFYTQLHITLLFPHNKVGWWFGLVEWIQSEQYPWYWRKWWALSSFVILTCKLSWVMGMLAVSIANFVICFQDHL